MARPLQLPPSAGLLSSSRENHASRRLLSLALAAVEDEPISSFTDMANTGQICISACSEVSAQFRRIISRADMKSQIGPGIATIGPSRCQSFKPPQRFRTVESVPSYRPAADEQQRKGDSWVQTMRVVSNQKVVRPGLSSHPKRCFASAVSPE